MEKFSKKLIERTRLSRSAYFGNIAKKCHNIGITPNIITTLSLISGLIGVYFLFNYYILSSFFLILHIVLDGFDGVLARLGKSSKFGKYYDVGVDSFITLLIIIKMGLFLDDYYAFVVAGLFTISVLFYVISRLEAPILLYRTVSVIVMILFSATSAATLMFTIGYLTGAVASGYSLARQLQWFITTRV